MQVAAVNISAGYYSEHSRHEYVNLRVMEKNIERVGNMLSTPSEKFEYIEAVSFRRNLWGGSYYEEILDFERYYHGVNDSEIKTLLPLPDTAYVILPNCDMEECDGQYLLDSKGHVYEFLYDLGVAVAMNSCEARSENGMPVRFKEQDAIEVEVVPVEFVFDAYEDLG
ncbi:hypothetical protein [Pelosinus propionicus]|uniref:hypothetical protein n=1 Tax=Pelosinus propionicus TaxID=380084 RepID=UPI000B82DF77|nr:hypothetical protein [Pelosinus propionicus]